MSFNSLNLLPELIQATTTLGYTEPTPIQAAVIPLLLEGKDLIGRAQTGTGKTAAFALPMLQLIKAGTGKVQGLILTPTRELALQVSENLHDYAQHTDHNILVIYGGQAYERQTRPLKRGLVDIVVGTPGRLLDLARQGALDLKSVKHVVLDEADEMLSMGFEEDIESIFKQTTKNGRQTAVFSATMPPNIRRLAKIYLHQPEEILIEQSQATVERIDQRYYLVNEEDKLAAITRLFEVEEMTSTLIFTRTRLETGRVANELAVRGFPAEALSGDLTQVAREHVMNRFKTGKTEVLVATDVASRGIDIEDITHVINFDPPQFPEIYVHRVGRTGRAGRTGTALTLITPRQRYQIRRIEEYTNQTIPLATLPTPEEIQEIRAAKLEAELIKWLKRDRCKKEKEQVQGMIEAGYDPISIAAAALKLAQSEDKKRPIAAIGELVYPEAKSNKRGRRGNNERRPRPTNGGPRGNRFGGKRTKGDPKGKKKKKSL